MRQGHVTGEKVETQGASAWYASIEAANIQAVEDAERALVTALAHQVGNAVAAMPDAAPRITKAAALVQARAVWPLSSGSFLVGSSDTDKAYLVRRGPWTCDCPDHTCRGRACKHIVAVQFTVKMGAAYHARYN